MTYETHERAIATGAPFECYKFVTPLGEHRFTSLPYAVTVAGEEYEPGTITRTVAEITPVVDTLQTVDFHIPIDYPLARFYAGRNVPDYLTVQVLRAHEGTDLYTEFTVEWRGEATNYGYDENGALVVATQSILQAKVKGTGATVFYQLSCNHRVYNRWCKADPEDFTEITTVTRVDNQIITVALLGHPADELALAKMVNHRTGEERTVYEADAATKKITITYPFLDIKIGDTVSLILGCDNRMETCITRFDNIRNFGGYRFVPTVNPFAEN